MRVVVEAIRRGELHANPRVVISNNADASALGFASSNQMKAVHASRTSLGPNGELDAELLRILISQRVDIVVLSGYLRRLGPKVLRYFSGRILNVHPSLLPLFGGKGMFGIKVHRAVIAAGETESGATVHFVDAEYDCGKIICQKKVAVALDDTPETLARRVANVEGNLLVQALNEVAGCSPRLNVS